MGSIVNLRSSGRRAQRMWVVYPQSVTHCQRRLAAKFQFAALLPLTDMQKRKCPGSKSRDTYPDSVHPPAGIRRQRVIRRCEIILNAQADQSESGVCGG